MNTKLLKTSFGFAAIASVLAVSGAARAASLGDCAAYNAAKPHLYVAGSSAIKPFIQAISTALAADQVIVYVSGGSCVGVGYALKGDPLPTGTDLGIIGADTCTVPAATKADIGVSDVFATSCDGVAAADVDGFGDFQGPVQVMNFVVPKGSFDNGNHSISAEAAYLVFGFDPASNNAATNKSYADGTPWTAKDDIWIRGAGSGTQSMISAAIGVLPGSWALNAYTDANNVKHAVAGGSGEIVTRVGGATNLDTTIGILASTELDAARATVRGLAFQAYDQSCGYWPDSTSSGVDKLNVRTGKYDIWGPLHMYAPVEANGDPTNPDVQDFADYVNGSKLVDGADPLAIVKLEVTKNLVPQCAMQVSRDSEIGELQSVNPTCSCFYESVRLHGDDGQSFAGCDVCDDANPCADDKLTCSYGFCEAI
jgi:ABC-type phosphate transport system substrate-binding protein